MNCPACENKARPGYYEQYFLDLGLVDGKVRIWKCLNCGELLTHGFISRSRPAPEHLRAEAERVSGEYAAVYEMATGERAPDVVLPTPPAGKGPDVSRKGLEELAQELPGLIESGEASIDLDFLDANLTKVTDQMLDHLGHAVALMPKSKDKRAAASLIRDERRRRGALGI